MYYRNRSDGALLTQGEVRNLHANTAFPAVWDSSVCEFIGIDPVLASPIPEKTRFQTAFVDGAIQDTLGNWVEKWTVTDWDQDGIAAALSNQWATVRSDRNKLLKDTDWTQIYDAPVEPMAWTSYRQALRDITTQADPFNIVWPVAPN